MRPFCAARTCMKETAVYRQQHNSKSHLMPEIVVKGRELSPTRCMYTSTVRWPHSTCLCSMRRSTWRSRGCTSWLMLRVCMRKTAERSRGNENKIKSARVTTDDTRFCGGGTRQQGIKAGARTVSVRTAPHTTQKYNVPSTFFRGCVRGTPRK